MDIPTLGTVLAVAKKTVLPEVAPSDEGAIMVVNSDGEWTKGSVIGEAIVSVSGDTLYITTHS